MEVTRERGKNWLQMERMKNLETVKNLVRINGGWLEVLQHRMDFERYVMNALGCTLIMAKDYIDTIRGALVFEAKMKAKVGEQATSEGSIEGAPK